MISTTQIENGVSRWLDKELMPKLPTGGAYDGLKKATTVALALYAIKRAKSALDNLARSEFMGTIGATDAAGNIDIEGYAEELKKQMPENGLHMNVPMIGELTFYRSDIDDMLRYIKS